MDNIIVSMNDNVLVPQDTSNFVSPNEPVYVQENIVDGYSEPCTVQVGQTITGEPNTPADVVNVGTEQHAVLNFTIPRGADGRDGIDGIDGLDGDAATIQIGTVTTGLPSSNAEVTNVGTDTSAILDFVIPRGSQGLQGEQGIAGQDGVSPRAYVEAITGGGRIVIEDSETTTTVDIMDGTDGTDGTDGFSPIATVTPTASGATISITDAQGTTTANITNGVNGTDGTDGYSPSATVSQSGGTTTITITDAQGTTSESITVPTQLSDLGGTISTSQIANGAVTPAKLAKGVLSLGYYSTSVVTVSSTTYSALASGSITTHGGDLQVSGYIYGVKTGGGTVGLLVKIDNNTPTRVSMHNLQGNSPLTCDYVFTGISAGSHTVSYGVAIQSGSGNSYTVNAYCEDRITFVEL